MANKIENPLKSNDTENIQEILAQYREVNYFMFGLAAAKNKEDKWGVINVNNEVVIPFEYKKLWGFESNNLCVAQNMNGKYGVINTENEAVIPFIYDDLLPRFNNNMLVANYKGKWGVINEEGNTVIPFVYQGPFAGVYDTLIDIGCSAISTKKLKSIVKEQTDIYDLVVIQDLVHYIIKQQIAKAKTDAEIESLIVMQSEMDKMIVKKILALTELKKELN